MVRLQSILSKQILATTIALTTSNVLAIDCNSNIPESTPVSRFVINGDGTVSDYRTGLIWKRCREGRFTGSVGGVCESGIDSVKNWQAAFSAVNDANSSEFAGASNWRLPNVKELMTLVEHQCRDPAINTNIFPFVLISTVSRYWTSTPYANKKEDAWVVDFKDGITGHSNKNSDPKAWRFVRLVRDGNQ